MDGRQVAAAELCNIAHVRHVGEVTPCNGNRRFFNFTRPHGTDAAADRRQREHADPVKEAPQSDGVGFCLHLLISERRRCFSQSSLS